MYTPVHDIIMMSLCIIKSWCTPLCMYVNRNHMRHHISNAIIIRLIALCSQERKPMILHLQLANKMASREVWIISRTTLQFLAWNSFIQSLSQCKDTYCSKTNLLFVAFHTAPQFKADRLTGWHHPAAGVPQNTSPAAAWEELHHTHMLHNNKALASSHSLNSHSLQVS